VHISGQVQLLREQHVMDDLIARNAVRFGLALDVRSQIRTGLHRNSPLTETGENARTS